MAKHKTKGAGSKHVRLPKQDSIRKMPDPTGGGSLEGTAMNAPGPMGPPGMPSGMAAAMLGQRAEGEE